MNPYIHYQLMQSRAADLRRHAERYQETELRPAKTNTSRKRGMKIRRVVATLVAATAGGAGLLLATAGTATAADNTGYSTLVPASDWLNVAVAGGSFSPGAPIIQWWATGGAEQEWQLPHNWTTGEIINQNSGMCVTTDGVAGDQLYQEPCGNDAANQQWYAGVDFEAPTMFTNPATGLVMDVSAYAMYAGGHIDAWYGNGAPNQYFWNSTAYYG